MSIKHAEIAYPQAVVRAERRAWLVPLSLWLALRLLTWLWAILVSGSNPHTPLERGMSLWPPGEPTSLWIERTLLEPFYRRDTVHYVAIVERGYRLDDGTAQFHPLLPWLGRTVAWATGLGALSSLLLVSSLAALGALLAFERLARLDLPEPLARRATLYLAVCPLAFVLFMPYTEGLFVLWSSLALLWARQERWWAAGLAGGLAALTRQQGIVLLLPLAWELWARSDYRLRLLLRNWPHLLALGLVPAGLLAFKLYRVLALGEVFADFRSLDALIYSLFISRASVVPVQSFSPPWKMISSAIAVLGQPQGYAVAIDLTLGTLFLLLAACAWRQLRWSYRLYVAAILLLSFCYYTGPYNPTIALPRHCLLATPLFLPLATWGGRSRILHLVLVGLGLLGMLFLQLQYGIEGWVP